MITTLLAIETSARIGGVALLQGGTLLVERSLDGRTRHASAALPTIRSLLAETGLRLAEVDCVAFSRGPGSFTGVRVSATIARMLHDHGGAQVVAAPTLAAIAENFAAELKPEETLAVVLDAKRGQVYSAAYRRGPADLDEIDPPSVRSPGPWISSLREGAARVYVAGAGLSIHRSTCSEAGGQAVSEEYWQPRAATIARLGWRLAIAGKFCDRDAITPLYLRPPECEEVFDQRQAEARAKRGG